MLIRSFGVAITIATLWWPSSSFGLGLGEINVESTLASPLKATIHLRGMDKIDLSPDQFFIRLDGTSKLNIQYRLERTGTNTATIILYTRKAVTEPLFHFRIEVEWDEGIIARSYDVLIDPASYKLNSPAEEATTSVPDEISESVSEPIDIDLPIISSVAETAITTSENHTGELVSSTTESRREYGPTENGNSIWRVANKVATESKELSVYQWMYGIWKANPRAFTRSNMHRLKTNEFISVPFEWEVGEISRAEAYQTYAEHLALLQLATQARETLPGDDPVPVAVIEPALEVLNEKLVFEELVSAIEEPAVTTAVLEPSNTPAAEVLNGGEVVLVLPETLDNGVQSGIIAAQAGTVIEVPATQDNPDNELQAPSSRTVKSRSDYIEQLPVIGASGPLAILGRALQQTDAFISSRPSWWVMAFSVWVTLVLMMLSREFRSRPGLIRDLKQKVRALVPAVSTTRESIQISAGIDNSLDNLATENKSDEPAEPGKINSDIDEIMAEADVFMANGNIDKIDQDYITNPDIVLPAMITKPDLPKESERLHTGEEDGNQGLVESDLGDAIENDEPGTKKALTLDQVELMNNKVETIDTLDYFGLDDDDLDEVDVYLAYGLYDNAEDLLNKSLESSPNRADYRAKLLDTYFATKNAGEFVKQAEALKGMGDAANRHWDRVQVMGYELVPDNELFSGAKDSTLSASDLGIAKPEAADFDLGSGADEGTTFGEDDFLLGEETDNSDESSDFVDTQTFVETVPRDDDAVAATQVIKKPTETPEVSEINFSDLEFALNDDEVAAEGEGEATVQPDNSEEETMKIIRAEEIDFEQLDPAILGDEGEDLLAETQVVNLEDGVDPEPFDGRILHFPGSQSEDEKFSEFESDIKMTLQAIRDQIQQMNERLFSQERSSSNLKKTISEIKELGNFQSQEEPKKSN